jgi:hypothetical protein
VKYNFSLCRETIILSLFILLTSCHFNSTFNNRVEDKDDAQKTTEWFYDMLKSQDYKATYELFSDKFYAVTDTQKLSDLFHATNERLGSIETFNMVKCETHVIEGTDEQANYALIYSVKRKNYDSKETLVLDKENGKIKIVSYSVNSDGFLAPGNK